MPQPRRPCVVGKNQKARRLAIFNIVRFYEIDMTDAKGSGHLEKCDQRWISTATLQATQVLLAQARSLGNLLLSQALCLAQPAKISSHEALHIHGPRISVYILYVYQL